MPKPMTVQQLRDILDQHDGDTTVCGAGHFGEMLGLSIYERKVSVDERSPIDTKALVINIEDAGPEPD